MADQQIGNTMGVAAVKGKNLNGGNDAQAGWTDGAAAAAFDTGIGGMRTRLAAIDGAYYTADRLDQMSYNDMVYALRVADDPTTIK